MREQLRFYYRYPFKYWRALTVAQVALLASVLIGIVIPLIIRQAIDVGITQRKLNALLMAAALVFLVGAVRTVLVYLGKRIRYRVSSLAVTNLRRDLFKHILYLGPLDRKEFAHGQLLARLVSDTTMLRSLSNGGIFELLNQSILVLAIIAISGFLDWQLTLIMLVPHILVAVLAVSEGRLLRMLTIDIRNQFSTLTGAVGESMRAIHIIKVFGQEEHQTQNLTAMSRTLARRRTDAAIVQGLYNSTMSVLASVSTALVFWFGAQRVAAGEISIGTVIALLAFSMMVMMPLQGILMNVNEFFRTGVSADRLRAIFALSPTIEESPDAIPTPRLVGEISVEHASVHENEQPLLSNINLHIAPGEFVAITGPTGSGKSILLMLLARLRDATWGTVRLDGWQIRDLKLASLRQQVGYVPQRPWLFEGTLAENITFAHPEASRKEILEAVAQAELTSLLERLPDGLDTHVGTKGLTLSGGERQRIALARVLLSNPSVLLLDNPTANVDAETQAQLIATIVALRGARTIVVTTQQPALAEHADRVVVLNEGRLMEHDFSNALDHSPAARYA